VPWAIINASYQRRKREPWRDGDHRHPNRGHALTIDARRREVADMALASVRRYA
jgi:hypothetical protein